MKSNRSRIAFVVVSLGALASLRAVAGPEGAGRDPATRALSIFSEVFSLTRSNYVEPADSKALLEGAYDGMSDALDPFSYYVPASAMAAYKAQQSAGAADPGIVFARRGGYPYVVGPLPGSPAEKAGIKAGDLLDSVDGKPLRNAPFWKVKAALDGPEGSSVELGLFRGGDEKKLTIPVDARAFRRAVALHEVGARRRDHPDPGVHAGHGRGRAEGARRGRAALDLEGGPRPARLDRRRPGRRGSRRLALSRQGPDRDGRLPQGGGPGARGARATPVWKGRTVILTDDSTAGPAEVLAAALHDRAKATTVGETTVGMAIIQRSVPTQEGGTLFMTVGRYVSPSGQVLGGKGVSPDERVIVFPGETGERDLILERGLEVVRADAARQAA